MSQLSSTPPRRSSIVFCGERPPSPPEDVDDLKEERAALNKRVRTEAKNLKSHGSLDAAYWARNKEITALRKQTLELTRRISLSDFKMENPAASVEAWEATTPAVQFSVEFRCLEADERIFEEQRLRVLLDPKASDYERRKGKKSWVEIFMTSHFGMSLNLGRGPRLSTDQTNFKAALIKAYQSEHSDPDKPWLWCPILSRYKRKNEMIAAHLFPTITVKRVWTSSLGTRMNYSVQETA